LSFLFFMLAVSIPGFPQFPLSGADIF
jgi:hypothetical protein